MDWRLHLFFHLISFLFNNASRWMGTRAAFFETIWPWVPGVLVG
jgi:hypothetical protein